MAICEMKIEHIAIWAKNLEGLKLFYEKYFNAQSSAKYTNAKKHFQSYFLTFSSSARLELMQRPDIQEKGKQPSEQQFFGYAHLAMSVGSETEVNALSKRLVDDGYRLLDGPRRTGDGYYESTVLDPDGNRIEITV